MIGIPWNIQRIDRFSLLAAWTEVDRWKTITVSGINPLRSECAKRSRPIKNFSPTNKFLSSLKVPPSGMHSGPLPRRLPGEFPTDRGEPMGRDDDGIVSARSLAARFAPCLFDCRLLRRHRITYIYIYIYIYIDSSERQRPYARERRAETKRQTGDAGAVVRRDATRQTSVPHACGGRRESVCVVYYSRMSHCSGDVGDGDGSGGGTHDEAPPPPSPPPHLSSSVLVAPLRRTPLFAFLRSEPLFHQCRRAPLCDRRRAWCVLKESTEKERDRIALFGRVFRNIRVAKLRKLRQLKLKKVRWSFLNFAALTKNEDLFLSASIYESPTCMALKFSIRISITSESRCSEMMIIELASLTRKKLANSPLAWWIRLEAMCWCAQID